MDTCLYCCGEASAWRPLIVPCNCKHVHEDCLARWRVMAPRLAARCEICGVAYRVEELPESWVSAFDAVRVVVYVTLASLAVLLPFGFTSAALGHALRESDAADEGGFQRRYPAWASSDAFWLFAGVVGVLAIIGAVAMIVALVALLLGAASGSGSGSGKGTTICICDSHSSGGAATKAAASTKLSLWCTALGYVALAALGGFVGLALFVSLIAEAVLLAKHQAKVSNLLRRQRVVDFGGTNRAETLMRTGVA